MAALTHVGKHVMFNIILCFVRVFWMVSTKSEETEIWGYLALFAQKLLLKMLLLHLVSYNGHSTDCTMSYSVDLAQNRSWLWKVPLESYKWLYYIPLISLYCNQVDTSFIMHGKTSNNNMLYMSTDPHSSPVQLAPVGRPKQDMSHLSKKVSCKGSIEAIHKWFRSAI